MVQATEGPVSPGKVVVTGAGSGMGAVVATELARAGYDVIALDVDGAALARLEDRCSGLPLTTLTADVTDPEALEQGFADVVGDHGALRALIACAGVHEHAPVAEGSPSRWAEMVGVNLLGVGHCVRAALPHLLRSECADVVVWGSVSGFIAYADEAMYAASKAGVTHLIDCLRVEVVKTAVRTTVIHPGLVDTQMTRAAGWSSTQELKLLDPEDIARAVSFVLAQPAHVNITELVIRPSNQPM